MASDTTEPIIQHAADQLLAYGIGTDREITTVGNRKVYIQSASVSEEGDVKTYKDNVGQTVALVIPERYQTLQLDGIMVKEAGQGDPPKRGDEVSNLPTIEGVTTSGVHFRLESFSVSWQNEDVAKVSMSVRGYKF